jgi:hypothetical protein
MSDTQLKNASAAEYEGGSENEIADSLIYNLGLFGWPS